MTNEEILKRILDDCTGLDFICDEMGGSAWCNNHCQNFSPDIECIKKYYEEN